MKLEEVSRQTENIESRFKYRSILFIGSESYDAATVTVIEGLEELGFTIYTLHKPNINSWFCNRVIEKTDGLQFDFILSNLHWGTRWDYYQEHHLMNHLKVLIDGDDNWEHDTWRDKYERYKAFYAYDPPPQFKTMTLHPNLSPFLLYPFFWMEPLGEYKPDLVFTSQKSIGDTATQYLPFGMHREYLRFAENQPTSNRPIHLTHVPGTGERRRRANRTLKFLRLTHLLPGKIHLEGVRGEIVYPEQIREPALVDKNIHSFHRWGMGKDYYRLLNQSRILFYPGVNGGAWWDSKRPWEAYAAGCLVMYQKPEVKLDDYSVRELCPFAWFDSWPEFVAKYWYLYLNPAALEKLRLRAVESAWKYFSPKALARYFLYTAWSNFKS